MVGSVDSTGEPLVVLSHGKHIPISSYKPAGLRQHFSRSTFKSYYFGHAKRSGVGHKAFQQNEINFLDDKCIILPLTANKVLNHNGNVVDNVHFRHSPRYDCVAFKTNVRDYRG